MSFRKQVKKLKKDLEKRHEEAIETKDDTGSGDYGTIFLKDATPEGMEFWRPEYGEHLIDIIPSSGVLSMGNILSTSFLLLLVQIIRK